MAAQSEAARPTEVPTTTQQEAQVPGPSAAPDSQQRTGEIGSIGTISGSHGPTIVGSRVDINYSSPLEGPGVPELHSQRTDQQRELRVPSYQEAGNKTRDILGKKYRTTGSFVQLLPGVDNDNAHIAGIYTRVQLETREGFADATSQKGETVNSTEYVKIFGLKTTSGDPIDRLIFFSVGGVGKSTIFDKIAYDWADGTSEILNRFKLVFLLKMCGLVQESDLFESIFDQLLGQTSGIERDELEKFVLDDSNPILILLDGFDEIGTKTLEPALFGSVLKALNRKMYRECFICVSTRPSHLETLMSQTLVQNPSSHIEVLGFTEDDVREYVGKFFDEDLDSRNALIQTFGKSYTLRAFAANPMLLLYMCLLWRESHELPKTISRLFAEVVDYMFTRKPDIPRNVESKTVISTGKTALRGLASATQKCSFQEDEFEPNALDLALKAGIVTKQTVIKSCKSHSNIQFMHKTMQEYCAAKYLQSLNDAILWRLHNKLKYRRLLNHMFSTLEGVVSNEYLFRFCCGDNKKCMTGIVNLLYRKFRKSGLWFQTDVVRTIIQNCFFESQSEKFPRFYASLLYVPSTIRVKNSKELRSLVYVLKDICESDDPDTVGQILAGVKTIEFSDVSSVGDIAFAQRYMRNLWVLSLSDCNSVKGDIEKTMSSLKFNKHLKHLGIDGCRTLGDRASQWTPYITHLTSLNKLEITNCELHGTDIEHIASAVGDMPELSDLIFYGNYALGKTAELWAKALPKMRHLERLDLGWCGLTPTDIEHIAAAVGDMPRLTDLILRNNSALGKAPELWAKALPKMRSLNKLDLEGCDLTPSDIEHIAVAVHVGDMPKLTDLILRSNKALGKSGELWAKELPKMRNLNKLDLGRCDLTPPDMKHIAAAVGAMPELTDLHLDRRLPLDKIKSRSPSLRVHDR